MLSNLTGAKSNSDAGSCPSGTFISKE